MTRLARVRSQFSRSTATVQPQVGHSTAAEQPQSCGCMSHRYVSSHRSCGWTLPCGSYIDSVL